MTQSATCDLSKIQVQLFQVLKPRDQLQVGICNRHLAQIERHDLSPNLLQFGERFARERLTVVEVDRQGGRLICDWINHAIVSLQRPDVCIPRSSKVKYGLTFSFGPVKSRFSDLAQRIRRFQADQSCRERRAGGNPGGQQPVFIFRQLWLSLWRHVLLMTFREIYPPNHFTLTNIARHEYRAILSTSCQVY